MDEKFNRRFTSFCNSLDALSEAKNRDFSDSFVLSGTSAKYYAITGFVTGSPREVLREAFKANLISDEAWMEMLKVRNELTHDYDCEIVKTHCDAIVKKYIDLFYIFADKVKRIQESVLGRIYKIRIN